MLSTSGRVRFAVPAGHRVLDDDRGTQSVGARARLVHHVHSEAHQLTRHLVSTTRRPIIARPVPVIAHTVPIIARLDPVIAHPDR